jgi:hypothetical protein
MSNRISWTWTDLQIDKLNRIKDQVDTLVRGFMLTEFIKKRREY